jgi:hypothetical protein
MEQEFNLNDDEDNEILESAALGSDMSWRDKAMRKKFAHEYLTVYDATAAAVRCGYHRSYAREYAVKFMEEPYTIKLIQTIELGGDSQTATPEEAAEAIKKRVLAGLLREAHFKGQGSSQSARVAALSKLAQMHGMDAPTKTQTELTGRDGKPLGDGVFVLPSVMSPEEWEAAAAAQQDALVSKDSEVTKH